MGGYVPLSDTIPWSTEWQQTLFYAILILAPLTLAARDGVAGVSSFMKRNAKRIVALLCVGAFFDWASTHRFPVHSSGIVVVTGASSGIGRSAAIALARQGYTVHAGVRKEKDADAIKEEAAKLKLTGSLLPLTIDVTDGESISRAAEVIAKAGKPMVALVNNAGITSNMPLELVTQKQLRRNFDVNVFGLVETTQAFLPLLRKSKGRVVNVGSIAGNVVVPGMAPYGASKHAVEGISDGFRAELLDQGISVSLVKPGAIRTEIYNKMLSGSSKSVADQVNSHLATGRGSNETKELYRLQQQAVVVTALLTPNDPMQPGPEITDAAIAHAVTSPYPKPRYLVGGDAIMLFPLRTYLLPDRVWDCFFNWLFHHRGWVHIHGNVINGETV